MIHRNDDGTFAKGTKSGKRFKKEGNPWNKGLKGIHLHPDTEFKVETIDSEINKLVYQLYDLTEEEIKIIEEKRP